MPRVLPENSKPLVGISACLLGDSVRYDGDHRLSALCIDVLSEFLQFQKICPEVAIGMGVPRQPVRLVGEPASPRALGVHDATVDVTDALIEYGTCVDITNLSGFILQERSPSCGLTSTKLYDPDGELRDTQQAGLFTRTLAATHPQLPMEECARLHDPLVRENFIQRVRAYHEERSGRSR